MRRVLVFKETLLPPSETFILAQLRALRGFVPTLAGLERSFPSLPLPMKPLLLTRSGRSLSDVRAKLYRRTGTAPLFHRRARAGHPDLIHAHFASGGRSAVPLARALGVPLVVTLHGKDVTAGGREPGCYRSVFEEASCFICVSRFIHDRAVKAGFPQEKLVVHYIGIDRRTFVPSGSQPRGQGVLFVGRLVEKKGCEYLIRAMERVQGKYPLSELTIIGDGPLRSSLEALAGRLKIRSRFLGTQYEPAIREALMEARVFCVPSVTAVDGDSEGLGMVFAEAQAMGVPIVSTRHGGIPEVVADGLTGLLVPERDDVSLADALARLLGDDGLWRRFRSAALELMGQHFDLEAQTADLERIYRQVLRE